MKDHKIHPLCDLFPDIPEAELQELADDIGKHGQRQPIVRWKDRILDGKNRLAACKIAGVNPEFDEWFPTDPSDKAKSESEALDYVLSVNLRRRQLTESQRSLIAGRIATLQLGDNQHVTKEGAQNCAPSQEKVAKQLDVSRRMVQHAKKVLANGSAELVHAVDSGDVAVADAAKVVDLPKKEQTVAVKAVKDGKAATVAKAAGINPQAARNAAIMDSHKANGKPSGGTGFDPAEFDPKVNPELPPMEVDKAKPIDERIKEQQSIIERYARGIAKFVDDNRPTDDWLDDEIFNIIKQQLSGVLGTIRQRKAHGQPCRKCGGKGCKRCRYCGYMPRTEWESAL